MTELRAQKKHTKSQMEYRQGVRNIIATPHYRLQMFETPIETVEHQFLVLRQLARKVAPDLHVYLGCEFHSNMEMVEMLRSGEVHTMVGSRYVLTEFSGSTKASYIRERLYSLLSHGYKPIVAHIERYECMRKDIGFVEENGRSRCAYAGECRQYHWKDGLVPNDTVKAYETGSAQFVGSDCHGTKERISRIGEAYD